jgi:alpha-beta hydrolase superfamily lysophospholipase
VVVWGPILGLTGLLLILESRRVPRPIRRAMVAGLVMLVVAIAMEAATPILFALGFDHGSLPYETEAVIEEGLELGGFLAIWTGLAGTVVHRVRAPEGT